MILPGEEDQVGHRAHEDEDAVKGEGDEKQVEISVVPLTNAVTNPGTVVVEPEAVQSEDNQWSKE